MKNLLLSLCVFAAGTVAATANPSLIYGGAQDAPTSLKGASNVDDPYNYIWKGKDGNNSSSWSDLYVAADISTLNGWVASATGGLHNNAHFVFDNAKYGVTTLTGAQQEMFGYNGVGISLGYYFEAAEGSTGVINATNANGLTVNLASQDCDAGGTVWGLRGREFSIGNNVTLNALSLKVSGKLTTSQENYTDSFFEIKNGGTVSLTNGFIFGNTNLYIQQGGVLTSNNISYINNGTYAEISGKIESKGVGFGVGEGGGTTVVTSTGSIETLNGIALKGGELVVNGYLGGFDNATAQMMVSNNSTLTVGDGANFNVAGINIGNGGTLNLASDVSTAVIRTEENAKGTAINVASGKVFTAGDTNFKAGSELTINGDFNITNSLGIYGDAKIDSGTITVGNAFTTNTGATSSLAAGATVNASTYYIYTSGYAETSGTINAVKMNIASLGTLNILGGTTTVGDGATGEISSLANAGEIIVASGGTLYLKSTTATSWSAGTANNTGSITVDGGLLKGFSNISTSYAFVVNGTVDVKNNGRIEVEKSTTNLGISSGTLSTDSTARISTPNIVFGIGSNYANEKIFKIGGSSVLANTTEFVIVRTTNNKIELASGDSYIFGAIKFHSVANWVAGAYNELTITLNGSKASFAAITSLGVVDSLGRVIFSDFENELVKVDNLTTEMISTGTFKPNDYVTINLVAYDKNGNLLDGTWSVDVNGYLFNSALVPEPADFAAVFGALALAFALRRRRRS